MKKLKLKGNMNMNCYIIENDGLCYIIDPGYQKEKIIRYIDEQKLQVEGILLTHGHFDHIGAIDCCDVPVYIFEDEYHLLLDDDLNCYNQLGIKNEMNLSNIDVRVFSSDDTFNLGDKEISVVHTPGHTQGSVCFVYDKMIFTGDTLFCKAVGKSDFPTGDLESLKMSVVNIIESYDNDYEIHPGHNESSTIGSEKLQNPYYLMWKK